MHTPCDIHDTVHVDVYLDLKKTIKTSGSFLFQCPAEHACRKCWLQRLCVAFE